LKRDYKEGVHDITPKFFIGNEVEKTNCEGMRTLFIVGDQETKEIIGTARLNNCKHIYLGANQSLKGHVESTVWQFLALQIKELTDVGLYVTLDTNVMNYSALVKHLSAHAKNPLFTINISVPIEHVEAFRNVYVKIDDTDFNNTNSGVWIQKLQPETFTPWAAYTNDTLEYDR